MAEVMSKLGFVMWEVRLRTASHTFKILRKLQLLHKCHCVTTPSLLLLRPCTGMMKLMWSKHTLKFIGLSLAVVGGLMIISYILAPLLTSDAIRSAGESLGMFGPLVLIGYTIVAHVLSPLAGTPGFLVGVTIFGVEQAILYIYIGSMISAAVNFTISRRFGRGLVVRFVGKHSIEKVDEITEVAGVGVLTVLRLLGIAIFEEISYAAGLTNMRFRTYMCITILASIPPHALLAFLFRNADFENGTNLAFMIGGIAIAGILATLLIHYYVRRPSK